MTTQQDHTRRKHHRYTGTPPFSRIIEDILNTNLGEAIETVLMANRAFVNVTESESAFEVHVAAPGLSKSDFKIEVNKGKLNISADRPDQQMPEGTVLRTREFDFGKFQRTYTLDERVDADQILAKYEHGVLIVHLPKKTQDTWKKHITVE